MSARLLAVLAAALTVAGCANDHRRLDTLATLMPPANESHRTTIHARGVQIYECRAAGDAAAAPGWVFVAPEADLYDDANRRIGRHGAGPSWQADDGSRVVAQVARRADAPNAGAIPWLLLSSRSEGAGAFAGVTHIQRVNTVGGVAPAAGCTRERLGASERVAYVADYRFFAVR